MYRRLEEHMTYTMFIQYLLSTSRYIVEFPEGFSFVPSGNSTIYLLVDRRH
jgi:hypothetical protein